jgi:hypothetical protein
MPVLVGPDRERVLPEQLKDCPNITFTKPPRLNCAV